MTQTVLKIILRNVLCLIMITAFSCDSDEKNQGTDNQNSATATKDEIDPYLNGCDTYSKLYDKTERINKSTSNRFIGVYGFNETDSMCWDALYEEANNLVPPDTNIKTQNSYFIRVKNITNVKSITYLKQILDSDSLKNEVIASDNTFGDDIKHFPFRK